MPRSGRRKKGVSSPPDTGSITASTHGDLRRWAQSAGLTEDTIKTLITAGFDTIRAIRLIREQDIVILQLATLGQSRLLEEGVAELNKQDNPSPSAPVIQEPGVANLADLLASCDIEDSGADSKRTQNSLQPDQDPRLYLRGDLKGQNDDSLKIVDFISSREEVIEEELAQGADGTSFLVRKSKKKIQAHDVTPAEWITANARIQHTLMSTGQLQGDSMIDYMGYTAKIGQYATLYTWTSVMTFDAAYRQLQAAFSCRWGSESQHLVNIYLKRRQTTSSSPSDQRQQRSTGRTSQSTSVKPQGPFTQDG